MGLRNLGLVTCLLAVVATVSAGHNAQAQARQKLITSITAGSPPDCCQVWDNWVGEFDGMGAVEDLTGKVKDWKHYNDVLPIAWHTETTPGADVSQTPRVEVWWMFLLVVLGFLCVEVWMTRRLALARGR